MSVIHAPKKQELEPRMFIFIGGIGVAFVILALRLWFLQVVKAEDFRDQAARARLSSVKTLAPRGLIYDRKDRLIAGVRTEIVVTGIPSVVRKKEWVLQKVAELVEPIPEEQEKLVKKMTRKLEDGYFRPTMPTPIHVGLPMDVAQRIADGADDMPGIGVEFQGLRYYPNSTDMAHILGYVWTPSPGDLERINKELNDDTKQPAAYVGKQGFEKIHEIQLMGAPGNETLEVNNRKSPVRVVGRENPTPGLKLISTIDRDLQKLANELLRNACSGTPGAGGAVVMMEPKTGEVLCLASYPSFDASLFEGGISTADYEALSKDPLKPFNNRAISSAYPPGSTFKILTSIAAAREHKLNYSSYQNCNGYFEVGGGKKWKCENHPRGALNYFQAFSKSCNTYFGRLADTVRREGMTQAAVDCGFGSRLGIDTTGEVSGIVPTKEWWAKNKPKDPFMRGHLVNMGIGQGELGVTPLQMCHLVNIVANEGIGYRPHFLKATVDKDDVITPTKPEVVSQIDLPTDFWNHLKEAMVGVNTVGTARGSAPSVGVRWGGKTGSAEHRRGQKTHAWYVGVAPMDQPEVTIAVVIEKSGHGGDIAAPIASKLVSYWFKEARASSKDDLASLNQGSSIP